MTQQLIDAAKALLDYATTNKSSIPWDMGPLFEALRAAVEAAEKQPVQEPVGEWVSGNGMPTRIVWSDGYVANANVGDKIYAAPVAQQEAKPLTDTSGVQPCCERYSTCSLPCTPRGRWEIAQAAKPLSGEQLRDIARTYKGNDQQRMRDHWDLFVDFAHEIEAAHGIGVTSTSNGGKTGFPPGLLQDDSKELSKALASKPDARMHAREAAHGIKSPELPAESPELGAKL